MPSPQKIFPLLLLPPPRPTPPHLMVGIDLSQPRPQRITCTRKLFPCARFFLWNEGLILRIGAENSPS